MSHTTKSRTHEENRAFLCAVCFKKDKDLRRISDVQVAELKALVDNNFSLENPKYQSVICRGCALALSENMKNPDKPKRKLLKPVYNNLKPPPSHSTRSVDEDCCPCTVCEISKCNIVPGWSKQLPSLAEKYWVVLFPSTPYPGKKDGVDKSPQV